MKTAEPELAAGMRVMVMREISLGTPAHHLQHRGGCEGGELNGEVGG